MEEGQHIRDRQRELQKPTRDFADSVVKQAKDVSLTSWASEIQKALVELDAADDDTQWDDDVAAVRGVSKALRKFASLCREKQD